MVEAGCLDWIWFDWCSSGVYRILWWGLSARLVTVDLIKMDKLPFILIETVFDCTANSFYSH